MKNAFPRGMSGLGWIACKIPRMMRDFLDLLSDLIKAQPVKVCILAFAVFLLVGVEAWEAAKSLPARHWNKVNLKEINGEDSDHFSFAVFGGNRNSGIVFETLLKMIDHDPEISFAVSLGDTVQSGTKARYRWFLQQVHHYLGIPLLTLMGHHERRGRGAALYHSVFGPGYFSFHIGRHFFIVLDHPNQKGLDPAQKQWLVRELEKSRDAESKIVLMHGPLYDPDREARKKALKNNPSEDLANLFSKYGISHIFAAHVPGYYEGKWKGIPFAVTGGAGAMLYGQDPEHHFFHFLKVGVKNKRIHVDVKRVPVPQLEGMNPITYLAWLYLTAFLRFHGLQTLLILIAAGSALGIYRNGKKRKKKAFKRSLSGLKGGLI